MVPTPRDRVARGVEEISDNVTADRRDPQGSVIIVGCPLSKLHVRTVVRTIR
jgi:hypothetical protein